ncbi:hypothetical protein Pelo_18129 [Pelomyxa schiedti]|nr:hypothetical protein Pelo_18129 [Pelomyxa schiedti]
MATHPHTPARARGNVSGVYVAASAGRGGAAEAEAVAVVVAEEEGAVVVVQWQIRALQRGDTESDDDGGRGCDDNAAAPPRPADAATYAPLAFPRARAGVWGCVAICEGHSCAAMNRERTVVTVRKFCSLTIGSNATCDFVLAYPFVAPVHATVTVFAPGCALLKCHRSVPRSLYILKLEFVTQLAPFTYLLLIIAECGLQSFLTVKLCAGLKEI